jgi:hypothetical protein
LLIKCAGAFLFSRFLSNAFGEFQKALIGMPAAKYDAEDV